jgi:hypothetical protein
MRKASKHPSEWLRLLCKDWADENLVLVEATDQKFVEYKPYLKGCLTSQLLCRLSLAIIKDTSETSSYPDLWGILGVQDDFDKAYIVAQVERFCSLYNIRGPVDDFDAPAAAPPPPPPVQWDTLNDHAIAAAAAAANGLPAWEAAAAVAAAAAATDQKALSKKQQTAACEVSKAHRLAKDAEKALEQERRQNQKREQRRVSQERKDQKNREREAVSIRKVAEKIAREASREDRRQKKLELRQQREKFAQEQKDAALKRAAELVSSNRVPIEITRGAAAAKAAATAVLQQSGVLVPVAPPPDPFNNNDDGLKKVRSAIVVSTADDLHQIVTHSKNLWAKYNAIAKEHNQKVNWITVAKELGIHVKVREKYARMHSRAEQRGFDWGRHGYYKIKDHPEIFLEPTQAEQKAKMPPPPPDTSTTVLISKATNKEVEDEAAAAVAAAAAVVDAAGVGAAAASATNEQTTAAAVAVTLVVDPTVTQPTETTMMV